MTTVPSSAGLARGTKASVSPALPCPTKLTFRTSVYLRTLLFFGSIVADNRAAASCHRRRLQSPSPRITAGLDHGQHRLKHLLISLTAQVSSHHLVSLAQRLPDAQLAGNHPSDFAGMCFNATASLVARVVQVRPSRPELNFMSTIYSRGARAARQNWKTCKHFALYAISENPMYIRANGTRGADRHYSINRDSKRCITTVESAMPAQTPA